VDVFIYFFELLDFGLDEIEETLEKVLQNKGEVTGSGTGSSGSNIDIEVFDTDFNPEMLLKLIRKALQDFRIPESTRIKIDGKEYPF
jgi:hypothetical protein